MLALRQQQRRCCVSHSWSRGTASASRLQAAQIEQVLEAVSQMLVRLEALRIAVTVAGGQYRQFFAWLLRNIRSAGGSAALLAPAPRCCATPSQLAGLIRPHASRTTSWSGERSAAASLCSHPQSCHAQKPEV